MLATLKDDPTVVAAIGPAGLETQTMGPRRGNPRAERAAERERAGGESFMRLRRVKEGDRVPLWE
jgi:hypothetical protein